MRYIALLLFATILFIAFAPFIFTQNSFLEGLDFRFTGQIGDTIGGITAPIIGVLNAVLLYITLRKQDKQIAKQDKHRAEDRFYVEMDRRIQVIRDQLDSIELDIDLSVDEPFEYAGKYFGQGALNMAITMFNLEGAILQHYKVSAVQWVAMLTKINSALLEAIIIIGRNSNLDLDNETEETNYTYVQIQVAEILQLYSAMKEYSAKYPNDPNLKHLSIKQYLEWARTTESYFNHHNPNNRQA